MSGRANLSPENQGHYALNILTQAAMHTRTAPTNEPGFPSSRGGSSLITNPSHDRNLAAGQAIMDEYNASVLSTRDLDTLAFGTAQHMYLNGTYNSVTPRSDMANSNDLGILNAESYDDGRGTARRERRTRSSMQMLPFGIAEHGDGDMEPSPDAEEHESAPKRKKAKIDHGSQNGEEAPKGKSRGRPRVSPKDETAADVSLMHVKSKFSC